ncbi:MAG: hypothetical protein AAF685_18350 [Cyanobacteria bacterium P01_C01_bin.89]
MQVKVALSVRQVLTALVIGAILLVIAGTIVQVGKYVFDYREGWTRFFNLDREYNLPSFFSAGLLLSSGILLRSRGKRAKAAGEHWASSWLLLGTVFMVLAADEFLGLHEILIIPDLAKWLGLPGFLRPLWVIPGAIAVGWGIWKFGPFWQQLPVKFKGRSLVAAIVYITGALLMEMVGGAYSDIEGQQNLVYALLTVVEEVLEIGGVILLLRALLLELKSWSGTFSLDVAISNRPQK